MSYQVFFHPKAKAELEESYKWYNERSEGLGDRFIESVNKRITEIAEYPERYPKKKMNFREATITKFPFIIIYELLQNEKVINISYVFHTKRNPRLKFKR
jgi:plasmid stabilization system protein ParE